MSRFTEPLVVTPRPDGHTWIVLSDFGYEVGEEGSADGVQPTARSNPSKLMSAGLSCS
jgi:hypothetical protein